MASPEKKRNPLIALEDWWTVWFGLVIILIATGFAVAHYSGDMPLLKVPKMGKWVSNPTDVFYGSKKTPLKLKDEVTLAQLAEAINAKKPLATAEIVSASGGVQLRITSDRDGAKEVIKVSPNLMGGEKISFTKASLVPHLQALDTGPLIWHTPWRGSQRVGQSARVLR